MPSVEDSLSYSADSIAPFNHELNDDAKALTLQLREKAEAIKYLRSLNTKRVLTEAIGDAISEWDHKEYPILSLAEYIARHLIERNLIKEEYVDR
jgi:hypothetical protein